MINPGIFKTF